MLNMLVLCNRIKNFIQLCMHEQLINYSSGVRVKDCTHTPKWLFQTLLPTAVHKNLSLS